jgi:hypothetical protein
MDYLLTIFRVHEDATQHRLNRSTSILKGCLDLGRQ